MKKVFQNVLIFSITFSFGFLSAASFVWAYNINFTGGFDPRPTYVYCYSGLSTDSKQAVHNACAQWNGGGQGDLVYYSSTTHSNTSYPINNSSNQITKGNRGINNYAMQTSAYPDSDDYHVVEADIDINSSYPWKNDGSSDAYDVKDSMTHELGHLVGIDDSFVSEATMYEYSSLGTTYRRTLADDDETALTVIYGI